VLGWQPRVGFEELVRMMIDSDMRLAEAEKRSGLHAHRSRET
jgi:hypothetical protein